jgi:ABC-type nitrate/sulfonate/bicarbonate transport system substrate-binding protein
MRRIVLTLLIAIIFTRADVFAIERHIHASAGAISAQQLPIFVAKDLGIFEKYGLDVDPLVITGGSTLLQALGANQFSVLTALKAWDLAPEAVQVVPSGNNMARLIAMEGGRIDATVIPNSSVGMASKRGMIVLANIAEIVKEFPDRTIIMERSYLQKEREKDVELLAKADPEWLASKSPNLEAEYNVVLGLLQSCRYGKHQLPDPEGNLIDVSE